MPKLQEKLSLIKQEITKSNKILAYYDTDADGLSSYLQLKKQYPCKITGIPYDNRDNIKESYFREKININEYDTLLFLDKPELEEKFLHKDKKLIWIDHHPTNQIELIDKYNIIHFNPLDFKEENYPVCYWIYRMTEEDANMAFIGTVSDYFLVPELSRRQELIDKSVMEELEKKNIHTAILELTYNSPLKKHIRFMNFLFKLKEKEIDTIVEWLSNISIKELETEFATEKNEKINKVMEIVEKYNKILQKALKKEDTELFIFTYRAKNSYASMLANELKYWLRNWKIICISCIKENDNWVSYSFRSIPEIPINEIVGSLATSHGGKGGGHPNAAGGSIPISQNREFMEKLENKFKELLEETKNY